MSTTKEFLANASQAWASGDFNGALENFEKAKEKFNKKQLHVLNSNIGACLMNLGRVEDAVQAYDEALSSKPDHAESHHNKGVALASLKRHKDALASFEACLKYTPDFYGALCGKSEALSSLENFEKAETTARTAISKDGLKPNAYADLGFACLKLRKNKDAVDAYKSAIKYGDTSEETKRLFAIALSENALDLEQAGNVKGAVAAYMESLGISPSAAGHHNMGILYVRLEENNSAIKSFEASIALDSKYKMAYAALGAVYSQESQNDLAIKNLQVAVALDPNDTETHYNLGLVLLKSGRDLEAKREFDEVLKLDPNDENAKAALKLVNEETSEEATGTSTQVQASASTDEADDGAKSPTPSKPKRAKNKNLPGEERRRSSLLLTVRAMDLPKENLRSVSFVKEEPVEASSEKDECAATPPRPPPGPPSAAPSAAVPSDSSASNLPRTESLNSEMLRLQKRMAELEALKTTSPKAQSPSPKSTYSHQELKTRPFPTGVDPAKREEYLTLADFKSIFNMTPEEFTKLPKWKRTQLKKKHGLF